jgi:hypothetical protein
VMEVKEIVVTWFERTKYLSGMVKRSNILNTGRECDR